MADRLYTSQKADEILSGLRMETKLDKFVLARMAFILSLSKNGIEVKPSLDFSGASMNRPTFVGSDEIFLRSLISYVYKKPDILEDEFYSNKSIIKNHIDSGSESLWDIFEKSGKNLNHFYNELLNLVDLDLREARGKGLDIFLGRKVLSNDEVIMELNDTYKHANSHLAIMGKPGVGKTQLLLKILADIRTQSNYQINFIYFDYKGDVVENEKFIETSRARLYRLLQNNEILPINPFVLGAYDEQSISVSAREKAESFSSINSKFGVVQKGALSEAIKIAYAKRAVTDVPYPDFRDIREIATQMYEEQQKKDDTLIEVLRDLSNFNLFWYHGCPVKPIDRLTTNSLIIDLHMMPVLKELVAYLVIERLYKEMIYLPDSAVKDNRRTIRTILVIDEAHNYLSQKNMFLQRIIREGRSKGIVVFFASQSPNDYQQQFFDFQELLEFIYIFQCEGISSNMVQSLLGCSNKTAKELQVEIANLEPFQVISKSDNKTEDFIKFKAESFYKNY